MRLSDDIKISPESLVTVTKKKAILIVVVTSMTECDTTLCTAAVSLSGWPEN